MDSVYTRRYQPMLGVRKELYYPRGSYSGVVVHTTGSGPVVRMTSARYALWRKKYTIKTPLEAALWVYTYAHNAGGHYLVGQCGTIIQTAPEALGVWQVGSSGARLYRNEDWCSDKYQWWKERWPELESPLQLAGGALWKPYPEGIPIPPRIRAAARHGSCNANAVGIEVVPPEHDVTARWSVACETSVALLVGDICRRRRIPLQRGYVVSHSDAHPLSRTSSKGVPWDPYPAQITNLSRVLSL